MLSPTYTPPAPKLSEADLRLKKLEDLSNLFDIKPELASKLRVLEEYETIIICDDSGSMSAIVDDSTGPLGKKKTRWDELCQTVSIITELATALDPNGIDIYFLNRSPLHNVTSAKQCQAAFMYPPSGFTPIVRTIHQILEEKKSLFDEGKKVLVILATDGQPTEEDGTVNIKSFTRLLLERPDNMYMSIVACTDDDSSVSYLSRLDSAIKNLDVVDDFKTEQRTMTKWRRGKKFTFGDYVVKILLASIDKSLDAADGKGQGPIYYMIEGISALFGVCCGARKSNKVEDQTAKPPTKADSSEEQAKKSQSSPNTAKN